MKKFILLIAVIGLFAANKHANAGIPILYGNGLEFEQLMTLPDSVTIEGQHVNFGLSFEQFSIFDVPLWNYGTIEYAAYSEETTTVYSLVEEDLEYLKETYNVPIIEKPTLSFWNRIGGKLVAIAAILGIIGFFAYRGYKSNDEAETETTATTE